MVSGLVLGCAWWGLVCWLSLRLYVWVVVRRCVCFGDWWGVLFVLGCVALWWVLGLIGFGGFGSWLVGEFGCLALWVCYCAGF